MFTLICKKLEETIKKIYKTKCHTFCSKSRYKMELNISYARETKKLKSDVRYYVANYKNDQDLIITAK